MSNMSLCKFIFLAPSSSKGLLAAFWLTLLFALTPQTHELPARWVQARDGSYLLWTLYGRPVHEMADDTKRILRSPPTS